MIPEPAGTPPLPIHERLDGVLDDQAPRQPGHGSDLAGSSNLSRSAPADSARLHSLSLASSDSTGSVPRRQGTTGGTGARTQGPWSGRQQRTPCCHGQPASALADHAPAGAVLDIDAAASPSPLHAAERLLLSLPAATSLSCLLLALACGEWRRGGAAAAVLDLFTLEMQLDVRAEHRVRGRHVQRKVHNEMVVLFVGEFSAFKRGASRTVSRSRGCVS
jgi:hypothetical protein